MTLVIYYLSYTATLLAWCMILKYLVDYDIKKEVRRG